MRNNQPVTQRELHYPANATLMSTTDAKGRITYANPSFVDISGYALMGQAHNIIRHPDMPRGVFKLFWDTLQRGDEIFAFVKNISMDGSFYWVLANVTPSVNESGDVLGYYSVRRKPNPRAVAAVGNLYREMLAAERNAGSRDAIAASTQVLEKHLQDKQLSYEQMILTLQAM